MTLVCNMNPTFIFLSALLKSRLFYAIKTRDWVTSLIPPKLFVNRGRLTYHGFCASETRALPRSCFPVGRTFRFATHAGTTVGLLHEYAGVCAQSHVPDARLKPCPTVYDLRFSEPAEVICQPGGMVELSRILRKRDACATA